MKKLLLTAGVLFPAVALAHVGDHGLLNWKAGFLHPLTGLDHLLALLATGVWLAQNEPRARLGYIAGFAVLLALAIAVGMQFTHITFEAGIVATLVVLGALMACAVRGPAVLSAIVVAATAAVHGFVQGAELPTGAGVMPFAMSLIASSVIVLGFAILIGKQTQTFAKGLITRVAGALLMLFAFTLAIG
jgi:urease accessory protein